MLSLQFNNRAIPVVWKLFKSGSNPGFNDYKDLLLEAHAYFATKTNKVILMADRFYACLSLVQWLNQSNFDYRLRLKSNVEIISSSKFNNVEDLKMVKCYYENDVLIFNQKTNLSWIFEEGHPDLDLLLFQFFQFHAESIKIFVRLMIIFYAWSIL